MPTHPPGRVGASEALFQSPAKDMMEGGFLFYLYLDPVLLYKIPHEGLDGFIDTRTSGKADAL